VLVSTRAFVVVVHVWPLDDDDDDCSVAFFGDSFPDANAPPSSPPYVLRYASTSLRRVEGERSADAGAPDQTVKRTRPVAASSTRNTAMQHASFPARPARIACAVDLSDDADPSVADHIVDVAAAWAQAFGATLVILHAAPPPPQLPTTHTGSEVAAAAFADVLRARQRHVDAELQRLVTRASDKGVVPTTLLLTTPGRLPDLLAHAADEQKADLLVLGSRARRGLQARLLGSVAERTAHLAHVPVLLLPPD
jgi:nucleotide-binding universal stress UspA family protein